MQEKYLHELGDLYDAEQQFLKAQQEMLTKASDATLKQGIEQHITETEQQIKNVEQVFGLLGEKAETEKCPVAAGLVTEGKQNVKEAGTDPIRDCFIGSALAKVEHYEIISYRGLIVGAQAMGQQQIVQLLQQNLQQEEKTAQKLEKSEPKLVETAMQAEAKATAR